MSSASTWEEEDDSGADGGISAQDAVRTAKIHVRGMTCGRCVNAIQTQVRAGTAWSINDKIMDQISIKTQNPKCRPLLVFNCVYRLEIKLVMLVFSTPLVN
jgi:hypothetical protein